MRYLVTYGELKKKWVFLDYCDLKDLDAGRLAYSVDDNDEVILEYEEAVELGLLDQ